MVEQLAFNQKVPGSTPGVLIVLEMVYKNLKHNYLTRLFDRFIFKKEKNSNKFIFVFKLPEQFTLKQKQKFTQVLKKNGITVRQIKTKFFINYFKTRPVNPQILSLFMGTILIGVGRSSNISLKEIKKELNDDLLIPHMIVDDSGLIFKSSYFFKINEFNLNFLIKKVYNKLITPQLKLKQILIYYKTTKLI